MKRNSIGTLALLPIYMISRTDFYREAIVIALLLILHYYVDYKLNDSARLKYMERLQYCMAATLVVAYLITEVSTGVISFGNKAFFTGYTPMNIIVLTILIYMILTSATGVFTLLKSKQSKL